jgi:hypothetical protein
MARIERWRPAPEPASEPWSTLEYARQLPYTLPGYISPRPCVVSLEAAYRQNEPIPFLHRRTAGEVAVRPNPGLRVVGKPLRAKREGVRHLGGILRSHHGQLNPMIGEEA